MGEVVRRQSRFFLRDGNIVSAIAVLDKSVDIQCGLNILKETPDTQACVQIDVAFDAIAFLLEKVPESENGKHDPQDTDLTTLLHSLPKTVQSEIIIDACLHVGRLVRPASLTEDEVLDSIGWLQDPAKCGERMTKIMQQNASRRLASSARAFVVQRSIDASLDTELQNVQACLERTKKVSFAELGEEASVAASFVVKDLGKLRCRLSGVLQKASDEMKAKKHEAIEKCAQIVATTGGDYCALQLTCFWSALREPMDFISKAILGKGNATLTHAAVIDIFRGRLFNLALMKPADVGFHLVLGETALNEHDKHVGMLTKLKEALCEMLKQWEFVDTKTSKIDIFAPAWRAVFACMKELRLFQQDRDARIFGERPLDSIDEMFQQLATSFAEIAGQWLKQLASDESWFTSGLKAAGQKKKKVMQWPAQALDKSIEEYQDQVSSIDYAVGIVEWLADCTTEFPIPASPIKGTTFAFLRGLAPFASICAERRAFLQVGKKGKKGFDAKALLKKLEAIRSLDGALRDAADTLDTSLSEIIQLEISEVNAKVDDAYAAMVVWYAEVTKASANLASRIDLDCKAAYEQAEIDQQKLLGIANSDYAKQFLEAWKVILAGASLPSEYDAIMSTDARKETKQQIDKQKNIGQARDDHQAAKDKVGEFVAIKALFRPLKPDEKRLEVRTGATTTITNLQAVLPVKLGLLMSAAAAGA